MRGQSRSDYSFALKCLAYEILRPCKIQAAPECCMKIDENLFTIYKLQLGRLTHSGQSFDVIILALIQPSHFNENTGDLCQCLYEINII